MYMVCFRMTVRMLWYSCILLVPLLRVDAPSLNTRGSQKTGIVFHHSSDICSSGRGVGDCPANVGDKNLETC